MDNVVIVKISGLDRMRRDLAPLDRRRCLHDTQGVAFAGAAGILNLESSTGAFILISEYLRVETRPGSTEDIFTVNGSFTPSTSRESSRSICSGITPIIVSV